MNRRGVDSDAVDTCRDSIAPSVRPMAPSRTASNRITSSSFTEKIAELYQFIYGDLTTMGNGSGDNLASIRLNRYPVAPAAEPTPC